MGSVIMTVTLDTLYSRDDSWENSRTAMIVRWLCNDVNQRPVFMQYGSHTSFVVLCILFWQILEDWSLSSVG